MNNMISVPACTARLQSSERSEDCNRGFNVLKIYAVDGNESSKMVEIYQYELIKAGVGETTKRKFKIGYDGTQKVPFE